MAQVQLKATARPRAGKGAARQARREGKVPAVIYGAGDPPETICVDYNELWKQVIKGHFTSTVFEIDLEGKTSRVIPRDLQVDPVKEYPIHVDFMRIGKDGMIDVEVPVRFINDTLSPGLKRGGVLNIVRHEIEVTCPYDKIPEYFEIDLAGLEIGRSIHISAVPLPENVRPTIGDRDFTIATIAGTGGKGGGDDDEAPAEAAAAPAEGAAAAAKGGDAKPGAKGGEAKPAAGGGEKKK